MEVKRGKCAECDCGGGRIIVNKKHNLCDEKNYLRRHGKTKEQAAKEKFKLKSIKTVLLKGIKTKLKRNKPVNKVSKNQQQINRLYRLACIEFDYVNEPVCSGCGRYQSEEIKLSHSHIISRADCKRIGRPELIYSIENLRYHCLNFGNHNGCHPRHENGDPTLLDYKKNIEYVKSIDLELYNKIVVK